VYEFSYQGWGYTTLTVTASSMTITSHGVDAGTNRVIDTVRVGLGS
jgi:hypothetical protein